MYSRNFKWRRRLLILKLTNCVQVLCKYRVKYKHNPVNLFRQLEVALLLACVYLQKSRYLNINRRSRTRSSLLIEGSCRPRRK